VIGLEPFSLPAKSGWLSETKTFKGRRLS